MTKRVLLLGIGNLLWADEGFGVRVIETLLKNYQFPEQVNVLDGGTQGIYLLEHVQACDVLIVFDAVDFNLPAATLHTVYDENVPQFMGAKKMSLHQTGFQEVLAMAEMLGQCPKQLLLIGVQPVQLDDYGGSLHSLVKAQIEPAIDIAKQYLAGFGIHITALEQSTELSDPILNMQRYEAERPAEHIACRVGDARVLATADKLISPTSLDGSISVPVDFRGQY